MRTYLGATVVILSALLSGCEGSSPVSPDPASPSPPIGSPAPTGPPPAPPAPQPPPTFGVGFDARDYIEAIFLGSGPLRPNDGVHGCATAGIVQGPRPGHAITAVISSSVAPEHVSITLDALSQARHATAGAVTPDIVHVAQPSPTPAMDQIVVSTVESPSRHGCPSDRACTVVRTSQPGMHHWSRVLIPPSAPAPTYAHEVGHALGFCHVDGASIGGADKSAMSGGHGVYINDSALRLTRFDVQAMRAVYRAGIRPGGTRRELLTAGLIRP